MKLAKGRQQKKSAELGSSAQIGREGSKQNPNLFANKFGPKIYVCMYVYHCHESQICAIFLMFFFGEFLSD